MNNIPGQETHSMSRGQKIVLILLVVTQKIQKLVRDALLISGITFIIISLQFFVFPLAKGYIAFDNCMFGIIFGSVGMLNIIIGIRYKERPYIILSLVAAAINVILFLYLYAMLSGPYDVLMAVLSITSICLNGLGMIASIGYLAREGTRIFQALPNRIELKKSIIVLVAIFVPASLIAGSIFNFGTLIHVQALDGFQTRSSYWGIPNIDNAPVNHLVTPANNWTIHVSNSTLGTTIPNLQPGSFMYADKVWIGSNTSTNYCDYMVNATSFSNGTVRLSSRLPSTTDVHIMFHYMNNSRILKYLNMTNSALIINYNNDFINSSTFFAGISKTYVFQLFEYWNLDYYVNVEGGTDFPNMFNYPSFITTCNRTMSWFKTTSPALPHFRGISLDFERGNEYFNPNNYYMRKNIGTAPLPFLVANKTWNLVNEQDPALFHDAINAYTNVFNFAGSLGYSVYVVYQPEAMKDLVDDDLDYTRLPVFMNPYCQYGMMSYQSGETDESGRWQQYEDCRNQQVIFGTQGNTILLG